MATILVSFMMRMWALFSEIPPRTFKSETATWRTLKMEEFTASLMGS